jgi:hypothetical protein
MLVQYFSLHLCFMDYLYFFNLKLFREMFNGFAVIFLFTGNLAKSYQISPTEMKNNHFF